MEPLVDSYGRRIKSMRISITDKCNFRCTYCMPAEGLPWLKKAEILSYEEIVHISRVAVEHWYRANSPDRRGATRATRCS